MRYTDPNTPVFYDLTRQNAQEPCPYVYPELPPYFLRRKKLARGLYLGEWLSVGVSSVGSLIWAGLFHLLGESSGLLVFAAGVFLFLPMFFLFRLGRRVLARGWKCPVCGQPFPCFVPNGRSPDFLREGDLAAEMRVRRIPARREKWCPLIFPASCPRCGKKFFHDPEGGNFPKKGC